MSDSFKVRERCSVDVVSARTEISSGSTSAASETPQGIDRHEPYAAPSEIQLQLTATSDVAVGRVEPLPPVPENMRVAYEVFVSAGISEHDARGLVFGGASPEEARQHVSGLLSANTSLAAFGPTAVAISVLARVAASEEVNGRDPRALVDAHRGLCVVRPDGYIARALSGEAIERAGELRVEGDGLRAGTLEVGAFYRLEQGIVYAVDEQLQRAGGPLFELSLDRMAYGRFLDGAEAAMKTAIVTSFEAVIDPPRSIAAAVEAFGQMGAVIMASPEMAERFLAMPLGDQIESVSNVAVTLALAKAAAGYGGAAASGGGGSIAIHVQRGGAAVLAFELDLAVAGALVGAGRGGLGLLIASPLLSSADSSRGGPASSLPELSEKAEASMKRASKLMSKEAAAEKRKMLPRLAAERERLMGKLDELLKDPNLSQQTRAAFRKARNAADDHLNAEDLTGALRDTLEVPVRARGTGDVWLHKHEVNNGLAAFVEARKSLIYEFQRGSRHGTAEGKLSELADELLDFANKAKAFIEVEQ
jgi:hypothetical protein